MTRMWRDSAGSVLVEYTVVFPLLILTLLGTTDVANMLFQWAQANKAAYIGARTAIVSNPIPQSITSDSSLYTSTQLTQHLGDFCFDFSTGSSVTPAACPSASLTVQCGSTSCTPS